MRCWGLAIWLIAVCGCDRIFGLEPNDAGDAGDAVDAIDAAPSDLDGDGILDDADDCIAPKTDEEANEDGDVFKNSNDPCPLDPTASGDTDADMVQNTCDPFPALAGDRQRCLMALTSPSLNSALWRPRAGEDAWAGIPGMLTANATAISTTITAASIEGTSVTTYDVRLTFDPHTSSPGSVTLWLRASPDARATTDIGCEYRVDAIGGALGVIEGTVLQDRHAQQTNNGVNSLRLRGTVVTTGAIGELAQVTCSMSLNNAVRQVSTWSVPLPAGRAGFSSDRFNVTIEALHVLDHP